MEAFSLFFKHGDTITTKENYHEVYHALSLRLGQNMIEVEISLMWSLMRLVDGRLVMKTIASFFLLFR